MKLRPDRDNIPTWLMVLLVGVPAAVKFYPPIFASAFGFVPNIVQNIIRFLPIGIITEIFYSLGIFSAGFWAGRRISGPGDTSSGTNDISNIIGCIEKNDVAWRFEATISNEEFRINTKRTPRCPECQTEMKSEGTRNHYQNSKWACPNSDCGHKADYSDDTEAKKIFSRHIEMILNDTNEPYFVDNIVDQINGTPSGTKIWEEYVDQVGNDYSDISTACL